MQSEVVAVLRDEVAGIIMGTVFVFTGIAACGVAVMRRWSGGRVLVWLWIWSAIYGAGPLIESLARVGGVPQSIQASVPYIRVSLAYLILVAGSLAWMELALDKLQSFLKAVTALGILIAISG